MYFLPFLLYDTGMTNKKYASPMDAALTYLTARMRTRKETEKKLLSLGYSEEETEATLLRLAELGLVNDSFFAEEFVRTRTAAARTSRAALKYQLARYQTDAEAAEAALASVSPEQELASARAEAEKAWRQKQALPARERRQKVLMKLCRKGYDMDTALAVCRELAGKEEEADD